MAACLQCATLLPDDAAFYLPCGTKLIDSHKHQVEPEDKFKLLRKYIPSELTKKILSAGKQIESEHLLFSTGSNFTDMGTWLRGEKSKIY